MILVDNEAPGIEERHVCASNTSSLLIDPHHRTQADVILAAGMSGDQLGIALVHLRAEWDRCDKPAKRTPAEIARRAQELERTKARHPNKQARAEALVWHAGAMRQRAMSLNGRSVVLGLLHEWAKFHAVDVDLLSPALFHWLAPSCPACDGHGKERIKDTPSLSDKDCDHCKGEGKWPRPLGAEVIHKHIARSIGRVKKDMAEKLYG